MKWYIVKTVTGKEKKSKEYLDIEIERLKMSNYIAQVLVPTERVIQIRDGKKIIKEKSLMPGHIMVQTTLEGEVKHLIKSIPNVMGFLSMEKGGDPSPLRESEVNRILGHADDSIDLEDQISIDFKVGENVTVTDGPFNKFDGVIEEVNEEKKKLKIMIKIFGRKTPVELNYMQVEKQ
ncbi:MAG: transcription termination/antitermination protein NusG [Flavobacteriales bacterium]